MKNKVLYIFLIFLFSTIFIACTEKVTIQELESQELIPALKALHQANLQAEIVRIRPIFNYRIQINKKDYAQALQIIKAAGLFKKNNSRRNELSRSARVLPFAPEEANLRRDYAYAGQLEETLSAVAGVASVHATVRAGGLRAFGLSQQDEPKATIIVRYRTLQDLKAVSADELKKIAAQVVPSLDINNVILVTTVNNKVVENSENSETTTQEMFRFMPFSFYLLTSEYSKARQQIIFMIVLMFLVGMLAGAFVFYCYKLFKNPNRRNTVLNSLSRKNTILFNRKDLEL
ncbi:MAG: hypothetical protein LBE20_04585 [Deltaproteobacteria bacterium]|jgi:type III secretory pathway lipoprotein EscJ|nr:hypothetical protein [Deltaproteobacteria bacterium]